MDLPLIYALAGILSGFLAGLLGVGGGIIMVPILIWLLPIQGIVPEATAHFAVGTSLACISFNLTLAAISRFRHKEVDLHLFKQYSAAVVFGAFFGCLISTFFTAGVVIKICFALFIFISAMRQLGVIQLRKLLDIDLGQAKMVGYSGLSAFLGVGGGVFFIPWLAQIGVEGRRAVATSTVFAALVAIAGTISMLLLPLASGVGYDNENLLYGYVSIKAAFWLLIGSTIIGVPIGTKLSRIIPNNVSKYTFVIFLTGSSFSILYGVYVN